MKFIKILICLLLLSSCGEKRNISNESAANKKEEETKKIQEDSMLNKIHEEEKCNQMLLYPELTALQVAYKPVIYLYPEETTVIDVKLTVDGDFTFTYPQYNNGWNVIAKPDGTIIDSKTNKEYSYLFWEAISEQQWEFDEGFVVKGEDTVNFLQKTLSEIGLTPEEYNEFIVYWAPRMENNKYNLISFQQENYEEYAKLNINPKPDSILRVFMAYKSLEEPVIVKEQTFDKFERNGFTVIEWGGTEVK